MEAARLAEIDSALAALGVPDARVAELLARHRGGTALADVDVALAALAEGVALPAASPLDLEVATAPTRDLEAPDLAIAEAQTRDLAALEDEPELTSEPVVAVADEAPGEPDPDAWDEPAREPLVAPSRAPAAPTADAVALQLDALFDDPALTASVGSAGDVSLAEPAAPTTEQLLEAEEPPGPDVHVPDELAALLEGEIDPAEFDAPTSERQVGAGLRAADDGGLASELEPEALEIDVGEVEIEIDEEPQVDALGDEDHTMVATPDMVAMQEASQSQPPPSPSQAPPEEKKGFLRKMFGKKQ